MYRVSRSQPSDGPRYERSLESYPWNFRPGNRWAQVSIQSKSASSTGDRRSLDCYRSDCWFSHLRRETQRRCDVAESPANNEWQSLSEPERMFERHGDVKNVFMAFLKRKRVKFSVDLQVCNLSDVPLVNDVLFAKVRLLEGGTFEDNTERVEVCNLSDVPLVNAVLFAKVRLLEGGTFEDNTERVEVTSHSASWSHRSAFSCRISADPTSGMLEKCLCRISIRKEQKGGKSYAKLGYVDINLSEFAASGVEVITRSYLLDGYGLNTRQDNSKFQVKVTMWHQSADPFFRVPRIAGAIEDKSLNPLDRKAPQAEDDEDDENTVNYRCSNPASDPAAECASAGGSSGVAEDSASLASDSRRSNQTATALRRLSQDRSSAPRVQNTRIDAGGVIDRILAESRLSEMFIPAMV